nr:hypothetical protein [Tanacetum cinerariifolium]
MLYDGNVIAKETNVISIVDSEVTLMLEEESQSKMLLKQTDPMVLEKKVNTKPINYVELNRLFKDFVDVNTTVNYVEMCNKCLKLEAEHIKQHNMVEKDEYNRLSKRFSKLEQHCISLKISMEKVLVITALKSDLRKIKRKDTIDNAVKMTNATTMAPGMYKLDPIILAPQVIRIFLWHLDPGCSKHMTEDRSQLTNVVYKFLGTVKFGNDQVAKIMRYGDYQIGNVIISRGYYVEGLGHNLFSVLIYSLDVFFVHWDMMASSPICLMSKATKTKSWLWPRRLSHLNFDALNHLARNGLVCGLPRLNFENDHLCSACAMEKGKKQSHKPKYEDTNQEKLYLLHMDLCGPMHIATVNGKKCILVIVDDYSRFTWVKFLASKDEARDFII